MRSLCAGLLVIAFTAMSATPLRADLPDPLHGYPGHDNGINTPVSANPVTNFGFTVSPGPQTGDFLLDVLVPNNETKPSSFTVTGTSNGSPVSATANLFSTTAWTSGALDMYLGLSATPSNPIGAFLPSTQALDPGATGFLAWFKSLRARVTLFSMDGGVVPAVNDGRTRPSRQSGPTLYTAKCYPGLNQAGFFVYQVDLGTTTLQDSSNPNVDPLLNIGPLPLASYLVAFLNTGANKLIATANSGALFETSKPPGSTPPVPEPSTVALAALGGLGFLGYGLRRRLKK
jgi:hypothetical protein